MKTAKEIREIMSQQTGTTQYHMFSPLPGYPVATDGAIAVAEAAECFWLLNIIGSYHDHKELDKNLTVWKLEVGEDETAIIKAVKEVDGENVEFISQHINYTNFPLEEITIWLIRDVILLPSEY